MATGLTDAEFDALPDIQDGLTDDEFDAIPDEPEDRPGMANRFFKGIAQAQTPLVDLARLGGEPIGQAASDAYNWFTGLNEGKPEIRPEDIPQRGPELTGKTTIEDLGLKAAPPAQNVKETVADVAGNLTGMFPQFMAAEAALPAQAAKLPALYKFLRPGLVQGLPAAMQGPHEGAINALLGMAGGPLTKLGAPARAGLESLLFGGQNLAEQAFEKEGREPIDWSQVLIQGGLPLVQGAAGMATNRLFPRPMDGAPIEQQPPLQERQPPVNRLADLASEEARLRAERPAGVLAAEPDTFVRKRAETQLKLGKAKTPEAALEEARGVSEERQDIIAQGKPVVETPPLKSEPSGIIPVEGKGGDLLEETRKGQAQGREGLLGEPQDTSPTGTDKAPPQDAVPTAKEIPVPVTPSSGESLPLGVAVAEIAPGTGKASQPKSPKPEPELTPLNPDVPPENIERAAGEPSPPDYSSLRKVDINRDRESRGDAFITSPARRTWKEAEDIAIERGHHENAVEIARRSMESGELLDDSQQAGMLLKRNSIDRGIEKLNRFIDDPSQPDEERMYATAERANLEDERDIIEQASMRQGGTEIARSLAMRKLTRDRHDDTIISVLSRARLANKEKPLTPQERATFERDVAALTETTKKQREIIAKMESEQAEASIRQGVKEKRKAKVVDLEAEYKTDHAKLMELRRKGCIV